MRFDFGKLENDMDLVAILLYILRNKKLSKDHPPLGCSLVHVKAGRIEVG